MLDLMPVRCLRAWLAPVLAASLTAAELPPTPAYELHAPSPMLDGDVLYAGDGFVLQLPPGQMPAEHALGSLLDDHGAVLMGDALRWDRAAGTVFAFGHVQVQVPPVQISAAQLAADLTAGWVEACDLQVTVERAPGVFAHLRIEHARLEREEITLRGVIADGGHGGLASLRTPCIRIRLLPPGQTNPHRSGAGAYLRDSLIDSPTLRLGPVPVFWWPRAFRDFTADYPWSYYSFGLNSRLGGYVRARVGDSIDLPGPGHARAYARADWHSLAGWGIGAHLRMDHEHWGHGRSLVHYMPEEQRYASGALLSNGRLVDPGGNLGSDSHVLLDAAHTVNWTQSDLYLRYAELPDPSSGGVADERFRSDYLSSDLDSEPLARQGLQWAWSNPWSSVLIAHEQPPHETRPETSTDYLVDAALHEIQLFGPVHVRASGSVAQLQRGTLQDTRLRSQARVSAGQWFGPLLINAEAGADAVGYDDEDRWRWAPQAQLVLGLNVVGRFTTGATHVIRPAIGVQVSGDGEGDRLPAVRFGDSGDALQEDARYLLLDLGTQFWSEERRFRLDLRSRWGLRDADRVDDDGRHHSSRLVDLTASWIGEPSSWSTFTGEVIYDGLHGAVRRSDVEARIRAGRLGLALDVLRDRDLDRDWEWRPGLDWRAGRYLWQVDLTMREDGRSIDAWSVELERTMIDGRLSLGYERRYNQRGDAFEEHVGLAFRLSNVGGF